MPKIIISREAIIQAIEQHKTGSVSGVYKALGGNGNVSGSTAKKIRELVPDIAERLKTNKSAVTGEKVNPAQMPPTKKAAKSSKPGKYPRSVKNPFREGSGYGLVFDILSAHPKGLSRGALVELYAEASRKNRKKAGFDVAVVLSAKDSPTGPRHQSCRENFWCDRENEFVRLRTA